MTTEKLMAIMQCVIIKLCEFVWKTKNSLKRLSRGADKYLSKTIGPHVGDRVMLNKVIEFLKEEDGQTSTEYILLVAVVALIVFKFKEKAQTELDKLTGDVFGAANSKIMNELGQ